MPSSTRTSASGPPLRPPTAADGHGSRCRAGRGRRRAEEIAEPESACCSGARAHRGDRRSRGSRRARDRSARPSPSRSRSWSSPRRSPTRSGRVVPPSPKPVAAIVEAEEVAEPEAVVAGDARARTGRRRARTTAGRRSRARAGRRSRADRSPHPSLSRSPPPRPSRPSRAEPVAVEPTAVAAVEPEPEPVAAAEPAPPAEDIVPQPTWRMVAPDPTVDETQPATPALPAAATVGPGRRAAVADPAGLARQRAVGRSAVPQSTGRRRRAASTPCGPNRTAKSRPSGPRPSPRAPWPPCVSCGLSLSATARFCRRCGTPQG